MAKDQNIKNCQQRLTYRSACHQTVLHGYVLKVKIDNSQSIKNPECSSRNAAGKRKG